LNPLVSIIIPAYNHEKYIAATLESILSQSYREIEVIIIDDGSTDNTWQIIKDYAEKDSRIKAYTQCNRGVGVSSQRGLELADGDWVTFCGSDDTFPQKAIEHLVGKCKDKDLVIGEYETMNERGECFYKYLPRQKDLPSLLFHSGAAWAKLFRKKYIEDNNITFPALLLEEDTVFLSRILSGTPRFAVVHASTYHYWEHETGELSLSRRLTPELFCDRAEGKSIALSNMKKAGYHTACERYFFMYADQLSKQVFALFDDPEREKSYSAFKSFILRYGWAEDDSRFIYLTKMSKACFEKSDYSEYLQSQIAEDKCDAVADMYALGQVGFKYILRYVRFWCEYKLKRKEKKHGS